MRKSQLYMFFVSSIFTCSAFAQADTLIYAEGKIISASTKEAVTARITYQSEPYGSKIGFLNGSAYNFAMFDNDRYSITVEAPGYAKAKYMVDPKEANDQRKVVKDIELGLPTSAEAEAEITRTPGKVMRLENLIFAASTSRIEEPSYKELDKVVAMLKDNPNMVIQLEGHTDFVGSPTLNMKLSQDRVNAVKNY